MNAVRALRLVGLVLFVVATAAGPAAAAPTRAQLDAARQFADTRTGTVAWAVLDARGRMHGSDAARTFPSASVTKAMLLVAALRRTGGHAIPADLDRLLDPMIRRSGNRAARAVHRRVGDAGIAEVARAARMRRLRTNGTWSNLPIAAADQARFFLRVDRLVPRRHRAYARRLLSTIVPRQSWGVPDALRPAGWHVLFKGGWRGELVHQAALIERDGERMAIAVLTDGNPYPVYGRKTAEGIAKRLFT